MAKQLKKSRTKRQTYTKVVTKADLEVGTEEKSKADKVTRARILSNSMTFNPETYEYDSGFMPANADNFHEVHTTAEMVAFLAKNPHVELDAKVLGMTEGNKTVSASISRDQFLESYASKATTKFKLRESSGDSFSTDQDQGNGLVGKDFTPYVGGPFYKNLYYYQDYIRMHSVAFNAFHHDPIAKAGIRMTRDFVLGRGFRVDSDNKGAMALWHAFMKANDLETQISQFCEEESVYGEHFFWKLPSKETKITYQLKAGDKPPVGIIPRVRLVDPSNIVEIVTYPEDITRKLFYVWLAPTQYQMYTQGVGENAGKVTTALKFIYRQIPADQFLHYKLNAVSNEKRGRSDLFPILGYLKRLRDSVNYNMVALQKQAAWAIDTTIDGNQKDINAYADSQKALGTVTQAGSEFIHSKAVTRTFLSNVAGRTGSSDVFEWCLSMIAAGFQIPVSYFGTHHSGSQTRASAIVGTEPVAKKFEMRQYHMEIVIKDLWEYLMQCFAISADCEVTFPEIITQDRSTKLKDLALAELQNWISPKRAAEIAAKELGITDYNYASEQADRKAEQADAPPPPAPLSSPGQVPPSPEPRKPSAVTGDEKKKLKVSNGF